jgi:hypothetical protein
MLLGRRASEVDAKKKSTVAEAFKAWTARSEGEESRNRKVKAQAEAAEDPEQQGIRSFMLRSASMGIAVVSGISSCLALVSALARNLRRVPASRIRSAQRETGE